MAAEATRAAAPPTREAAGAVRRRLAEAPASEREAVLLAYVREQVAAVLGLDPSHPPSDKTGLTDMGMDSLMAVELRNRLQGGLDCNLPSTLMFEHPDDQGACSVSGPRCTRMGAVGSGGRRCAVSRARTPRRSIVSLKNSSRNRCWMN